MLLPGGISVHDCSAVSESFKQDEDCVDLLGSQRRRHRLLRVRPRGRSRLSQAGHHVLQVRRLAGTGTTDENDGLVFPEKNRVKYL